MTHQNLVDGRQAINSLSALQHHASALVYVAKQSHKRSKLSLNTIHGSFRAPDHI